MTTELTELEITAVALVDNPANPGATVELFKAAPMADHPMVGDGQMCADCGQPADQHPTMKAAEPPITKEAPVADETKELEARVAELETERQALTDMPIEEIAALRGDDLTKFAKADEVDDVMKGLPEDVRKRLEDAEARVAKMEQDARARDFIVKAADFGHIGGAAELAPVLEEIDRKAPEAAKALDTYLKAAEARIAESGLFAEVGAAGDTGASDAPADKAAAMIEKFVADGMPRHEAITKVFSENPDLYEPAK